MHSKPTALQQCLVPKALPLQDLMHRHPWKKNLKFQKDRNR
jgi:hypothetical protein